MTELNITVTDGSDAGVTVNQVIKVNGQPGRWRVVEVVPLLGDGKSNHYRLRREGNRKQRRAMEAKRRSVK